MLKKHNVQLNPKETLKNCKSNRLSSPKDNLLTPLIKQLIESILQAELEVHLAESKEPNRKNGYSKKTIKTASGAFDLNTPRDRMGTFKPQIVKKKQTSLNDKLEGKIFSLYAHKNNYQSIHTCLQCYYKNDITNKKLNSIIKRLLPELQRWKEHNLEATYQTVWLDVTHAKADENNQSSRKEIYAAIGMTINNKEELLDLYLSNTENDNYWIHFLKNLKKRGIKNIFIIHTNNIKASSRAIKAIFPGAEVHSRATHQTKDDVNAKKQESTYQEFGKTSTEMINSSNGNLFFNLFTTTLKIYKKLRKEITSSKEKLKQTPPQAAIRFKQN